MRFADANTGSALIYAETDFGTGTTELRLLELDGGRTTVLAVENAIGFGHALSPDASRIAAASVDGIAVSNVDGSDARVIVPATQESNPAPRTPRWSPDGQWILYDMIWITGDAVEAWVVRADGTDAHQVADLGYNATWQPLLEPLP